MRGRAQVVWRCSNETRATTQRDFLIAQLAGRTYVEHTTPEALLVQDVWSVLADISFDTQLERDQVEALCLSRQASEGFILAGSYVQVHECDHDEGQNSCIVTVARTVK